MNNILLCFKIRHKGGENTKKLDNRLVFALILSILLLLSVNSAFAENNETISDVVSAQNELEEVTQVQEVPVVQSSQSDEGMLEAGSNVINVHVYDSFNETGKTWSEDGFKLSGATVNVYSASDHNLITSVNTDANGIATIGNLASSKYHLEVTYSTYNPINLGTVDFTKNSGTVNIDNVMFIPTFSSKPGLSDDEFRQSLIEFDKTKHFRFCFFARIEESKGIFEACNVIKKLVKNGYNVSLDIYGQIQEKNIESKLPEYLDESIKYLGVIHDDSIKILSSYYCLLFPTYYRGEGMAHSIVESFMAGLPVIASDWKFNSELVKNNETGFLFDLNDLENNLYGKIVFAIENKELIKAMRLNCYKASKKYDSDSVLKSFIDAVDENSK